MENSKPIKILFSGGGTAGSVSPLLAIADDLKKQGNYEFLWIGTQKGPERLMIERENIKFVTISNGKYRRYFSIKNFTDIFRVIAGFFQSIKIIKQFNPDLLMSAGGYVSVPVIRAGKFLQKKIIIHQMDSRPGLANKIMSKYADIITTTFEKSINDYGKKAVWVGNPMRSDILNNKISKREARQKLGINTDKKTVLFLGGGTGAFAINEIVDKSLDELLKFCQVIHLTGKGKGSGALNFQAEITGNYQSFEFLDVEGMIKVYAAADIVVTRSGMGVLTELSFLAKPSILIPMPNTHQEDNAQVFMDNEAALYLKQDGMTPKIFTEKIKFLLNNEDVQEKYKTNIRRIIKQDGNSNMIKTINKLLNE